MAKLRFHNNQVEDYTIILSNRSHQYYGQLTGLKDVTYNANLNSANEISFTVYKDLLQEQLWENLVDLKLIFVKELDEYFQIKVSIDDANDTTKSVTGISQCEAELSQLILYGMEINSENDITRDKDKVRSTVFYDPEHPDTSLLHRILKDKAPHYKIAHVDESLCKVYRVFDSIDGTSIYDFLVGECAEQFDCLFRFNSVDRSISAYDLLNVCKKCGKRGDFDKCPSCGCEDLKHFGQDTTIYVDKNNLTDSIHLEVNSDNIKNCFKLEGGDEVMTGAIRSLNPTGTDYIYMQRQEDLDEMPKELVQKLEEYYDVKEGCYYQSIDEYRNYSEQIYDLLDDIAYYESAMMPEVIRVTDWDDEKIKPYREGIIYLCNDKVYLYDGKSDKPSETDEDANFYYDLIPSSSFLDAENEAKKLTPKSLSPISLREINTGTVTGTVDSALINYAKTIVKSGYVKVEIDPKAENKDHCFQAALNEDGSLATKKDPDETGSTENSIPYHYGTWKGRFKITNYSDKAEVAYSDPLEIDVNDKFEEFIRQRVSKTINKNDDDGSVFHVLSYPLDPDGQKNFEQAIKFYSLHSLKSFYDAINSVLDVLTESNQAEKKALLYDSFYTPYLDRLSICQKEMEKRQEKIDSLNSKIETFVSKQGEIQKSLDLSTKLGDLYPIFCSYRREDKYSNSNYISDGLSNAKLLERAKEFWETAEKELLKASNGECTITSTLSNLLLIPAFKPFVNYFELGNWIRVRVEGQLYKLRLIGYSINFDSLQTINVTFSTVTKVENSKTERENIIESARSFATGMSAISKQVEKGLEANDNINNILQNGLNSGLVQIKNNENEEVIYDKHGILCRSYDDILNDFDAKQLKLTHNTIAFTDNNWKSVRQVIGEHNYTSYNIEDNKWETKTDYGLTTQFVTSGTIYGENQIIGGLICSKNYSDGQTIDENGNVKETGGSYINLNTGEFSFGGDSLYYRGGKFVINNGVIYSDNYSSVNKTGSYINLQNGEFSFGGDSLYYKYDEDDQKYKFVIADTAIGESLKAIDIEAENLHVKATNIKGKLTAKQINADGLNMKGGSLLIGDETSTYTKITEDGLIANNAKFNGTVVNSFGLNSISSESKMKNFEHLENGLDILNNIDIYKYHYKTDDNDIKKHIGLVIGDNYNYSEEVTTPDNTSVDLYSLVSVCVKAIQELQNEIAELEKSSSSNIN